jgi:hypothetical protein
MKFHSDSTAYNIIHFLAESSVMLRMKGKLSGPPIVLTGAMYFIHRFGDCQNDSSAAPKARSSCQLPLSSSIAGVKEHEILESRKTFKGSPHTALGFRP